MATTTYKGYELQSTGSNTGTWGATLNTSVFQIVDNNLGGLTTKSLSSSNVTLSTSESQSAILRLTGTLLANVIVTTSCMGFFFVENLTSGNFSVTLTNGAGTSIIPPQYARIPVLSDATNGLRFGAPAIPPGTIMDYAGASGTLPPYLAGEWLFCDGSSLSTTTYAGLFQALGYTYGGSGANFSLPDLRGRARFGRDDMGGSTAGRITSAETSITGTTLGSAGGSQSVALSESQLAAHSHSGTTSSDGAHTHTYNGASYQAGGPYGGGAVASYSSQTTASTGAHTHTVTVSTVGSGATHTNMPPAMIINALIKT